MTSRVSHTPGIIAQQSEPQETDPDKKQELASKNASHITSHYSQEVICCVEIGHTRIKAANIPKSISFEDLQSIETISYRSKPWLSEKITQVLKSANDNPLHDLLKSSPAAVSISMYGPIYENGYHPCAHFKKIPTNIKEALQNQVSVPLSLDTDSISWAIGALEFLKRTYTQVAFPAVAITLGTGIGMALIENEKSIKAVEIWALDVPYLNLSQYTSLDCPRKILEKRYLDELFEGEQNTDEKMVDYAKKYNAHFFAFCKDAIAYVKETFSTTVQSIFIGGGYSRFIEMPSEKQGTWHLLSPKTLTTKGVSPDIIQLLGCHAKSQNLISKSTYPSYEDIENFINKR